MKHLKKALQGVGNLSNKSVYEYTEDEEKTLQMVRSGRRSLLMISGAGNTQTNLHDETLIYIRKHLKNEHTLNAGETKRPSKMAERI